MDLFKRKQLLSSLYINVLSSTTTTQIHVLPVLLSHLEEYMKEKHISHAPVVMRTYGEIRSIIANVSQEITEGCPSQNPTEHNKLLQDRILEFFKIGPEWGDMASFESARASNEFSLLFKAKRAINRAIGDYAGYLSGHSEYYGYTLQSLNECVDAITKIYTYEDILDENFGREFTKSIQARNVQERVSVQPVRESQQQQ